MDIENASMEECLFRLAVAIKYSSNELKRYMKLFDEIDILLGDFSCPCKNIVEINERYLYNKDDTQDILDIIDDNRVHLLFQRIENLFYICKKDRKEIIIM